ncbi:unnamed protein product [Cochlearia groenlandica]
MAGLQYSFFPTDFFYPRASPPATSLVATNPKLEITKKRDVLLMIDETTGASSLSLLIHEKTNNQSRFHKQTWQKKKKQILIEDDL